MQKIKQNYDHVPSWLDCTRQMAPDFVAKDPKNSPVWEITGAEFSKAEIHTADGISIRFPRVTKIRDDKTCKFTNCVFLKIYCRITKICLIKYYVKITLVKLSQIKFSILQGKRPHL